MATVAFLSFFAVDARVSKQIVNVKSHKWPRAVQLPRSSASSHSSEEVASVVGGLRLAETDAGSKSVVSARRGLLASSTFSGSFSLDKFCNEVTPCSSSIVWKESVDFTNGVGTWRGPFPDYKARCTFQDTSYCLGVRYSPDGSRFSLFHFFLSGGYLRGEEFSLSCSFGQIIFGFSESVSSSDLQSAMMLPSLSPKKVPVFDSKVTSADNLFTGTYSIGKYCNDSTVCKGGPWFESFMFTDGLGVLTLRESRAQLFAAGRTNLTAKERNIGMEVLGRHFTYISPSKKEL